MQTETIFDNFVDLAKSFNKVYPMAAIWFEKPVITSTGSKVRIAKNDCLRIGNGKICPVSESLPATHIVLECKGTIGDHILLLELQDLNTTELLTLNIK